MLEENVAECLDMYSFSFASWTVPVRANLCTRNCSPCTVRTCSPTVPAVRFASFPPRWNGGGGNSLSKTDERDDGYLREDPQLAPAILMLSKRPSRTNRRALNDAQSVWRSLRVSDVILAINVLIFILQSIYGGRMFWAGAKVNSAIAAGQWYRLLSPIFLHSSASHLAVNSFSLYSVGPTVEAWFGKKRFLALYVMSGLCGNILSFLYSPVASVGASGAIFGLAGAMTLLLARHRNILGPASKSALRSVWLTVLVNFAIGLAPGARIDNFGHLGGLLGGIAFSYVAGPRLTPVRTLTGGTVLVDRPILHHIAFEMQRRWRQLTRNKS